MALVAKGDGYRFGAWRPLAFTPEDISRWRRAAWAEQQRESADVVARLWERGFLGPYLSRLPDVAAARFYFWLGSDAE